MPGGWETPSVLERLYSKADFEEVSPEMCGALDRARAILSVEEFAAGLENDVSLKDKDLFGLAREPNVVDPIRAKCLSVLGRWVRKPDSSDVSMRRSLTLGAGSRAPFRKIRRAESAASGRSRERDSAL